MTHLIKMNSKASSDYKAASQPFFLLFDVSCAFLISCTCWIVWQPCRLLLALLSFLHCRLPAYGHLPGLPRPLHALRSTQSRRRRAPATLQDLATCAPTILTTNTDLRYFCTDFSVFSGAEGALLSVFKVERKMTVQ